VFCRSALAGFNAGILFNFGLGLPLVIPPPDNSGFMVRQLCKGFFDCIMQLFRKQIIFYRLQVCRRCRVFLLFAHGCTAAVLHIKRQIKVCAVVQRVGVGLVLPVTLRSWPLVKARCICRRWVCINQFANVPAAGSYAYIRRTSDWLCKEHGLSVVTSQLYRCRKVERPRT